MFKPAEHTPKVVKIENPFNKEIVMISDYTDFDIKKIPLYDAIVLDYANEEKCIAFLEQIRASNIESIYLIPVFILSLNEIENNYVDELADGTVQVIQPEILNSEIDVIKQKRKQLKPFTITTEVNRSLIKLLRFSFTRDRSLKPIRDRKSIIGYKYPLLNLSSSTNTAKQEISTLKEAFEQEYFSGKFIDRMHLCSQCNSGFLNYKEVDPETGSSNLITENIIHHFTCAYVGPEGDFYHDNKLVCPKCNKTLRHIGVDYDKPSVMYRSLDSDNYFQEPDMKAECMNCGHSNDVESLFQFDVLELVLTDKGKQESVQPKGNSSVRDIVYNGFISYATFGTFLKYEIERTKSAGKPSSIALLKLNISPNEETQLGVKYEKLIEEISGFIVNNTNASNILSRSINSFFILFPDTPNKLAASKVSSLNESINTLIKNNVKEVVPDFTSFCLEINGDQEHQSILNDLRTGILKM